jgi:hypothetical protein
MVGIGFQTGDWVVYRKTKHSPLPGPRADNVMPAQHGDDYTYTVDKYWVVEGVNNDGTLRLRTRRGKRHSIRTSDPSLRKARWWERFLYRSRFESIAEAVEESGEARPSRATA